MCDVDFDIFVHTHSTICNVASVGQFQILKWLNEQSCILDETVCEHAVISGNLELVQWLHNKKN